MKKREEFTLGGDARGAALIDTATITAIAAEGSYTTRIYVPGGTIVVHGSYTTIKTRLGLDGIDTPSS
jgi:hypothetical protein